MNYTADFTHNTEDPLSESSHWINGLATGLDWQDIQKGNGHAYAYASTISVLSQDDCTAVLTGTWTQNQTVQATAVVNDVAHAQEIELRLNSTITANNNTGYEIDIVVGGGVYIVRWDGARGVNTLLAGPFSPLDNGGAGPVLTGSKWQATNVNGTITVYEDVGAGFVSIGSTSTPDTTYPGGSPGIGIYLPNGSGSTLPDVGWSAFSAQDDAVKSRPMFRGS